MLYSFKRTPLTGKGKINTSKEHQKMFQISIFTARVAATHLKQVKCSYFDSGLLTCLPQRVFIFKLMLMKVCSKSMGQSLNF